jgi:hypothetical protein
MMARPKWSRLSAEEPSCTVGILSAGQERVLRVVMLSFTEQLTINGEVKACCAPRRRMGDWR